MLYYWDAPGFVEIQFMNALPHVLWYKMGMIDISKQILHWRNGADFRGTTMLEQSVLTSVKNYLAALSLRGITVERAVVFGSRARGRADEWSDIDLLIISPQFDDMKDRSIINLLWRVAARTDSRIEPIPCGSIQWLNDDSSAIIEIARREGEVLMAA